MTKSIVNFHPRRSYARIAKNKVVTLKYAVADADSGEYIEYRDDLLYLHGGYGGAPVRIEEELEGLGVGLSREIVLTAEDAYGVHDPDKVLQVALDALPPEARVPGAVVDGESPDGRHTDFRVTAIQQGRAVLDGNHPLAGRTLRFVLEILDIRPATTQELALGYALRADAAGRPDRPPD